MLAVRKLARGIGLVEVVETAEPIPKEGEVLVKVDSAGICGTDLHIYQDEFATEPPVTLGHEFAGTIFEIGRGVKGWQVGDRITAGTYYFTCGECDQCRRGRPNLCAQRRSIGSKENGAFAPYIAIPAGNLYRLEDHIELEHAALTEPLACVVHGISIAGVEPGDNVAITGPGPIGMLALILCKAAGSRVLMLGANQDTARLDLAKEMGADAILNVQVTGDALIAAADLLGTNAFDLVIECSGAAPAVATLLQLVRRGGRFCQLGLFGKSIPYDADQICYRELTLTGTLATIPSAWRRALALIGNGSLNLGKLITHRFSLSHWPEALAVSMEKQGLKVLLKPNS